MQTITLHELSKTYPGGKAAVQNVSLALEAGEVFGFLGPNGAGKTTTVKLLTGMLAPTGGECRVLGLDPAAAPEKVHAAAGVVTEHAQMYDHMTGWQNLLFYAATFAVPAGARARRAGELLDRLGLTAAKDQKLAEYSTGMRQRLSLARALLHRPRVLFLDEPTSGLDPESAQNVNGLIRTLAREEGVTVFLCTHQLRYAQELCSRFGLMDEGRLLATGTLDELRRDVLDGTPVRIVASRMPASLPYRQTGPQTFTATVHSRDEIPPLVRGIVEKGGDIYEVTALPPTLEDVYFALTSAAKKETAP